MFRLSVKGRYGVLAILALSLHEDPYPLSAKSIAQKEGLSIRFLEQAMNTLKERGLIESIRGPHGGYRLARAPKEIMLSEVLQAVEGTQRTKNSSRLLVSLSSKSQILNEIMVGVDTALENHLNAIDFDNLSRRARHLTEKEALMFHI